MKVAPDEAKLFFNLYHPLLTYVAQKAGKFGNVTSFDDLKKQPLQNIIAVRNELYENPSLFDSFIAENPSGFSAKELTIVAEWKNFVKGTFYVARYLKNQTIFIDSQSPANGYGVLALYDSLEDILGPEVPRMVQTVLLPFCGKIVYDGLLSPYNVSFGSGIRHEVNASYQQLKARGKIKMSLNGGDSAEKEDAAGLLKFYLRNQENRDRYADEIVDLIHGNSALTALYHQEIGKITARQYKKILLGKEINDAWFGILDDVIIASGLTREDAERTARSIVPKAKWKFIYFFKVQATDDKS